MCLFKVLNNKISLIPSVRYLVGLMLCAQLLSCVSLFVTSWTIACQVPLSMGFSRQEYWSGLSFPTPGDLPKPGNQTVSLTSAALAAEFFTTSAPWEAPGG